MLEATLYPFKLYLSGDSVWEKNSEHQKKFSERAQNTNLKQN